MMKSSWGALTIMRPRTARRELLAALKEARARLESDSVLKRYHKRLVLCRFDGFVRDLDVYLSRLVLFAKPHWNHVWGLNLYVFFSSKTKDKCHNTAAMTITEVLRDFGLSKGYIKSDKP